MRIHKEGRSIVRNTAIFSILLFSVALYILNNYKWLALLMAVFAVAIFILVLQFFRNPKRSLSRNNEYVICPADGKIVAIEQTVEEEYFKDKRLQISVFMSPFNVHANWYPVSGKIKLLRYHEGKKRVAWHPKSSTENERTTIVIQKEDNAEILVRQIAGALANRIVCYPMEGDLIRQCAELGFIKFGSRVDVFLPLSAELNVQLNQKVKGGVDVLAVLK